MSKVCCYIVETSFRAIEDDLISKNELYRQRAFLEPTANKLLTGLLQGSVGCQWQMAFYLLAFFN